MERNALAVIEFHPKENRKKYDKWWVSVQFQDKTQSSHIHTNTHKSKRRRKCTCDDDDAAICYHDMNNESHLKVRSYNVLSQHWNGFRHFKSNNFSRDFVGFLFWPQNESDWKIIVPNLLFIWSVGAWAWKKQSSLFAWNRCWFIINKKSLKDLCYDRREKCHFSTWPRSPTHSAAHRNIKRTATTQKMRFGQHSSGSPTTKY